MYNACPYLHACEIKEREEEVARKEMKEIRVKMGMLEEMVRREKRREEEMSEFCCCRCRVEASTMVLGCGHLVCDKCVPEENCGVCWTPATRAILINDPTE